MMIMGIIGNIREKLGSKAQEIRENRARDKAEYKEHYDREYEKARSAEIKRSAQQKAKNDAYARAHPLENISRKLEGFGGSSKPRRETGGNSLGRKLAPLGDFGRSIGQQYNNPGSHLPSALRDFDKPARSPAKKKKITITLG